MSVSTVARRSFLVALGSALLSSCATAGTGGVRSSPDRITREELEPLESLSAFEAIQRLRPRWLQSRGPTSLRGGPALPRVHLDQSPTQLDVLRTLSVSEVQSMLFLSAADATTRYGTGYPAGLIDVRTRG